MQLSRHANIPVTATPYGTAHPAPVALCCNHETSAVHIMLPSQASTQFTGYWLLCMCLLQFVHRHSFIAFTAEVFAAAIGKLHTYLVTIRGQKSITIILHCWMYHTATACAAHISECNSLCSMQFKTVGMWQKDVRSRILYEFPIDDCACVYTWTQLDMVLHTVIEGVSSEDVKVCCQVGNKQKTRVWKATTCKLLTVVMRTLIGWYWC